MTGARPIHALLQSNEEELRHWIERRLIKSVTKVGLPADPASLAVALYCGIGSSSLNALVKAFERLHLVHGWNSSYTG